MKEKRTENVGRYGANEIEMLNLNRMVKIPRHIPGF